MKNEKKDFYLECMNNGFKQVIIVDTENVSSSSFRNLNLFRKEDTIILMETDTSQNLSYAAINKLLNTKAKVLYENLGANQTVGKNELDFKIVVKATELLNTRKNIFITIISDDKGYDSAIRYLKENCKKPWIRRCTCITSPRDIDIEKELQKII